jgi:hypothetical protein
MASESDVVVASFDALPPTLLRVIFLALPVELRWLDCERENDLSAAFKRRRLEPALAALEARAEVLMRAELDALRLL